jgi:hypothetical protein
MVAANGGAPRDVRAGCSVADCVGSWVVPPKAIYSRQRNHECTEFRILARSNISLCPLNIWSNASLYVSLRFADRGLNSTDFRGEYDDSPSSVLRGESDGCFCCWLISELKLLVGDEISRARLLLVLGDIPRCEELTVRVGLPLGDWAAQTEFQASAGVVIG